MFWRKRKQSSELDQRLMGWSAADAFSKRDLLRSVCAQGASGSGKTNFVGWHLANALAADRDIGGVILASKPVEDLRFWREVFARAGRSEDLLVFGPGHRLQLQPSRFRAEAGSGQPGAGGLPDGAGRDREPGGR